LRGQGLKVDVELRGRNVSKSLKYANSIEARFAGIVGADEVKKNTVTVKNMKDGKQEEMSREILGSFLLQHG